MKKSLLNYKREYRDGHLLPSASRSRPLPIDDNISKGRIPIIIFTSFKKKDAKNA